MELEVVMYSYQFKYSSSWVHLSASELVLFCFQYVYIPSCRHGIIEKYFHARTFCTNASSNPYGYCLQTASISFRTSMDVATIWGRWLIKGDVWSWKYSIHMYQQAPSVSSYCRDSNLQGRWGLKLGQGYQKFTTENAFLHLLLLPCM